MNGKLLRLVCILLALLLTACSSAPGAAPTTSPSATPAPSTSTPAPPTAAPKATSPIVTLTSTAVPLKRPLPGRYLGVYDPVNQRVLLINGFDQDVWAYDVAANQFTRLKDRPAGFLSTADYDSKDGKVIAFQSNQVSFWEYDPAADAWAVLKPVDIVLQGAIWLQPAYAYDNESSQVVMLTQNNSLETITLTYDLASQTFKEMNPAKFPNPDWALFATYDSKADRVMLWKGFPTPAVWSYDTNQDEWQENVYTGGPKEWGGGYSSVYVPDLDRTFYLYNEEFYTYDLNAKLWEKAKGDYKPGIRPMAALVYDPNTKKIVLYGGQADIIDPSTGFGDLWTYDIQSGDWVQQNLP